MWSSRLDGVLMVEGSFDRVDREALSDPREGREYAEGEWGGKLCFRQRERQQCSISTLHFLEEKCIYPKE